MCGRITFHRSPAELRRMFNLDVTPNLPARYNIAPSADVPVVRLRADGARELVQLRWGLVPFWAKELKVGYKMSNARAETVAEKPSYRDAFKKRRCLVVADGYYEWQGETPKQPWWIRLKSGEPFGFAGLWESWKSPDGETIETTTIITTEPNPYLATIHDRMPVILAPEDHDAWLAPDAPADRLKALLRPYPAEEMTAHKVGRTVNNARNDSPSLIEAVP